MTVITPGEEHPPVNPVNDLGFWMPGQRVEVSISQWSRRRRFRISICVFCVVLVLLVLAFGAGWGAHMAHLKSKIPHHRADPPSTTRKPLDELARSVPRF